MDSITIVTPNFNMGRYLEPTIQSVVSNLRAGDEYFIIDGGSNDGSRAIIEKYAQHLAGWVSEPDDGYADAIGKGFAKSRAALQCWINSGDLLLRGALDLARERLAHASADMIFGDDFYIDDESRVIFRSHGQVWNLRDAVLFGGWTPLQDACFWRRELYERVGGIDTNLKFAADYDLFLRFTGAGKASYVPINFSAYRRHAGQKGVAGAREYKAERALCRRREIAKDPRSRITKIALSAFYQCWARYRARVIQPLLRDTRLAGKYVCDIEASAHG
jgi:glycosyltransferase involved in cell wall biosynthesis